jgi:hypothetical protein
VGTDGDRKIDKVSIKREKFPGISLLSPQEYAL